MLTEADLDKITMDYVFRQEGAILAGLQCAAETDDKEMLHQILTECKNRGIDVVKLLRDDLERHERLWGKASRSTEFSGGKEIRNPLGYLSGRGRG